MRKIQKFTLSLLALATVSSWNAINANQVFIRVDDAEFATTDANLNGNFLKIGAGTLLLKGNNSTSMTNLQICDGRAQVEETKNLSAAVEFNTSHFNTSSLPASLEILTHDGTAIAPNQVSLLFVNLTTDGTIIADENTRVLIDALYPSRVGELNLYSGPVAQGNTRGYFVPSVLSNTSNVENIYGEVHIGTVGGTGDAVSTLTTGTATVYSGGLLLVEGAGPAAAPGATVVQDGGFVEVAATVHVPASGTQSDVFSGTLKFENNSTLYLRDNSVWSRDITVGAAN